MSLKDRFPELYFDEKTVVEQTLKKTPPSISQVMAKILVVNGISNNSLASELGQAAEDFYKGA